MAKQLNFDMHNLTLIEGTSQDRHGRDAKVCIPLRTIKFFLESRHPSTNEPCCIIITDTGLEIALKEPIDEIQKQYNDRLNIMLTGAIL